jgi:thienamycin biosynthesis protein ThnN
MNTQLAKVLAIHLDPQGGSPYWLERERELGFSLREEIRSPDDLPRLGAFDIGALRSRPYTDFVPLSRLHDGQFVFGETGGATGIPATTAYTAIEFDAAFVQPFLDCVDCEATFTTGHWLWLGPGGPHVIGKAAQRIARLTTGADSFSIDFDPRWFRRLAPGSMARSRYLDHLLEQAGRVIAQQDIRYLFCTPVVLLALLDRMSETTRGAIRFVYLGGMPVGTDALERLAAALPLAEFLSGYGNTLFGVTHELRPGRPNGDLRRYYPAATRLQIRVVAPPSKHTSDTERLGRNVDYGATGQVVMTRLDESCFLPNVMERDCAIRLPPPGTGRGDGLGDPRPPTRDELTIDNGIY